jgi:hypothetical protein
MVHLHVLVYGEYIDQKVLQALWSAAMGELSIVHIKAVRGRAGVEGALREVLKYCCKGETGGRSQPRHAAAVELAFRNVHRVSLGGAIRKTRVTENDGAFDDVQAADLHAERVLSCEACGTIGQWKWVCRRTPEEVELFGGFGLMASKEAIARMRSRSLEGLRVAKPTTHAIAFCVEKHPGKSQKT